MVTSSLPGSERPSFSPNQTTQEDRTSLIKKLKIAAVTPNTMDTPERILFIYFSLAVLGLHCCTQAFCSCGEQGLLFVAVHRLLIAVASLVAEHGL